MAWPVTALRSVLAGRFDYPPISGRLPPFGCFGDEEGLGVYREEEVCPAARLSSSRHLHRLLDRRGGHPHPAHYGALAHLDGHAYHLGRSFPSLLLSVLRAWSCARCRRLL